MERRNVRVDGPPLLPPPPRRIRPSAAGWALVACSAALVAAGVGGAVILSQRAAASRHEIALFRSEAVAATARVVRLQRRGGDDDRRIVVHYAYNVAGREFSGSTTLRDRDRDAYKESASIPIRYLASQPALSWREGRGPRVFPMWPAFAVPAACLCGIAGIVAALRRQVQLLEYGRRGVATITQIDKKRSDKGTYWRVHYEWTLLDGAKRQGRYNHSSKTPPAVGTPLTIIYDRDEPQRHSRYPLALVRVAT